MKNLSKYLILSLVFMIGLIGFSLSNIEKGYCDQVTDFSVDDSDAVTKITCEVNGNKLTFNGVFNGSNIPTVDKDVLTNFLSSYKSIVTDIEFTGNMSAGTSLESLFSGFSALKTITFGDGFDCTNVTSMKLMFSNCTALTTITLGDGFKTNNVTDVSSMFSGCGSLTTINNLNKLNTSKVTTMENMFHNCTSLSTIDVSKFDTSNVTTMKCMFYGCSALTSVDLNNFNMTKVTDETSMFESCTKLTTLNLSKFYINQNVTMTDFAKNSDALTKIYFGEGVTDWTGKSGLFTTRTSHIKTNVYVQRNSNTSSDYDVAYELKQKIMEYSWASDNRLDADTKYDYWYKAYIGFQDGSTVYMDGKKSEFGDIPTFTSSDLTKLKTKLEDSLQSNETVILDIQGYINFTGDISDLLKDQTKITKIYIRENIDTSEVTNMSGLFSGCSGLTSIEGLEYLDISNVTDMSSFFNGCTSITELDLSNLSFNSNAIVTDLFKDCTSLKKIILPSSVPSANEIALPSGYVWRGYNSSDEKGELYTSLPAKSSNLSYVKALKNISLATVSSVSSYTYTGSAYEPEITVTYGGVTLSKDSDYSVTYSNNTNAGTASIIIEGLGEYGGTKTVNFTINPILVDTLTFNSVSDVPYKGGAYEPEITVKNGDATLNKDTDYSVTYSDNTNAGTASIKIEGKGNYGGSKTINFTITKVSLADAQVSSIDDQAYSGSALTPSLNVSVNDRTLIKDYDYTLTYKDNTNVGTATITITGKNNYEGTKDVTFNIVYDLASNNDSSNKAHIYVTKQNETEYVLKGVKGLCETIPIFNVTSWKGISEFKNATKIILDPEGTEIKFPNDCSELFKDFTSLKTIEFNNKVLTTLTTNMNSMFSGCTSLTSLDLSCLDQTNQVTNMTDMFKNCTSLTSLDLSKFDLTNAASSTFDLSASTSLNLIKLPLNLNSKEITLPSPAAGKAWYKYNDANNKELYNDTKLLDITSTYSYLKLYSTNLNDSVIKDIENQTYTGNEIKPDVTITLNDEALTKDTDYTLVSITYSNNTEVTDSASVTITISGIGSFTGENIVKTKTFKIINKSQSSGGGSSSRKSEDTNKEDQKLEEEKQEEQKEEVVKSEEQIKFEEERDEKVKTISHTKKSYMIGYDDNTFKPTKNIERAEVAAMLSRLSLEFNNEEDYSDYKESFSDLEKSDWYDNYVGYSIKAGYLNGYLDGTFRPNENMTRAEFTVAVKRMYDVIVNTYNIDKTNFTDISGEWFEEEVRAMASNEYVNGCDGNTFEGNREITRAEACVIINNIIKRIELLKGKTLVNNYSDVNTSDWYYTNVVGASLDID